jgi:hypothetical protein
MNLCDYAPPQQRVNKHTRDAQKKTMPNTYWYTLWKNVHNTPIPATMKASWYKVIHDIIPINVRLHKIRMSLSDKCRQCGAVDMLLHRITECGDGVKIWHWSSQKIATILRTTAQNIPSDWLLHPQCAIWPPIRRCAVMWILANVVHFQTRPSYESTTLTFISFVKSNKIDLYNRANHSSLVANYLCVVDEP